MVTVPAGQFPEAFPVPLATGLTEGANEAGPAVEVAAGGVPVWLGVDDAEGVLAPPAAGATDAAHPEAKKTTAAAAVAAASFTLVRDARSTPMHLRRAERAPGSRAAAWRVPPLPASR